MTTTPIHAAVAVTDEHALELCPYNSGASQSVWLAGYRAALAALPVQAQAAPAADRLTEIRRLAHLALDEPTKYRADAVLTQIAKLVSTGQTAPGPIQAHSKSEFKRLSALGAEVSLPPGVPTEPVGEVKLMRQGGNAGIACYVDWGPDGMPCAGTKLYASPPAAPAAERSVDDAALKLLDECLFFCAQAKESHMDQEDRQGMASGLHDQLRDYLIDVGYIWKGPK